MSNKIKSIFLILIAIMVFPQISSAATPPEWCTDMDILNVMERVVTGMESRGKGGSSGNEVMSEANKSRWMVTCALSYGVTNIREAANYIRGTKFKEVYKAYTGYMDMNYADGGPNRADNAPSKVGTVVDHNIDELASSFERIADMDIMQTSLYERTRLIGMLLLILTFFVHLSFTAYKILIGSERAKPHDIILCFVRFTTLLLMIAFMREAAFFGIEISNAIRDSLLESPIMTTLANNSSPQLKATKYASAWLGGMATVTSQYMEQRTGHLHQGIDLAGSPYGTCGGIVMAPFNGVITYHEQKGVGDQYAGYGRYLVITGTDKNGNKHKWKIAHLQDVDPSLLDKKPHTVNEGMPVGHVGNSGRSTGPTGCHAHIEAYINNTMQNPMLAEDVYAGVRNAPQGGGASASSTVYTGKDSMILDSIFGEMIYLKMVSAGISDKPGFWNAQFLQWNTFWMTIVGWLAKTIASGVLTVLIILADVMMAISICLGPIVIALSMLPSFEGYTQHWIKGYITFLFYQPLATCFCLLSFAIFAVSLDAGFSAFVIICICYVAGCLNVPKVADSLSGTALMGIATTMALMPAMASLAAAKMTAGAATAGMGNAAALASKSKGYIDIKKIKKTVVYIIAVFLMMLMVPSVGSAYTEQEREAILNTMAPQDYPSKKMSNAIIKYLVDREQSTFEKAKSLVGVGTVVDPELKLQLNKSTENDSATKGVYNSSYQNACDTPILKYVLGVSKINPRDVYRTAFIYKHAYDPGEDFSKAQEYHLSKFVNFWSADVSPQVYVNEKIKLIEDFLAEAQKAFNQKMLYAIPLFILVLMFFFQLATVAYIYVLDPDRAQGINLLGLLPRFAIFLLILLFYRHLVGWAVSFSNYISDAIVPLEAQENFMSAITMKTAMLLPGAGSVFESVIASFFRVLTYAAIKILLIAKDVFLSISVIVGPICIALGFHTMYGGRDSVHAFLTGWLEGFVKLLLWGPLAAIMLWALGMLSLLTSMDMMSVTTVAITALAFLYSAGNLPSLAERMSGLAMGSLLTILGSSMYGAIKGTVAAGFTAGKLLWLNRLGLLGHLGTLNSGVNPLSNFAESFKGKDGNTNGGGGVIHADGKTSGGGSDTKGSKVNPFAKDKNNKSVLNGKGTNVFKGNGAFGEGTEGAPVTGDSFASAGSIKPEDSKLSGAVGASVLAGAMKNKGNTDIKSMGIDKNAVLKEINGVGKTDDSVSSSGIRDDSVLSSEKSDEYNKVNSSDGVPFVSPREAVLNNNKEEFLKEVQFDAEEFKEMYSEQDNSYDTEGKEESPVIGGSSNEPVNIMQGSVLRDEGSIKPEDSKLSGAVGASVLAGAMKNKGNTDIKSMGIDKNAVLKEINGVGKTDDSVSSSGIRDDSVLSSEKSDEYNKVNSSDGVPFVSPREAVLNNNKEEFLKEVQFDAEEFKEMYSEQDNSYDTEGKEESPVIGSSSNEPVNIMQGSVLRDEHTDKAYTRSDSDNVRTSYGAPVSAPVLDSIPRHNRALSVPVVRPSSSFAPSKSVSCINGVPVSPRCSDFVNNLGSDDRRTELYNAIGRNTSESSIDVFKEGPESEAVQDFFNNELGMPSPSNAEEFMSFELESMQCALDIIEEKGVSTSEYTGHVKELQSFITDYNTAVNRNDGRVTDESTRQALYYSADLVDRFMKSAASHTQGVKYNNVVPEKHQTQKRESSFNPSKIVNTVIKMGEETALGAKKMRYNNAEDNNTVHLDEKEIK